MGVCACADTNLHYLNTIKPLELLPKVKVLKVFEEPSLLPHEHGFKAQEELIRARNFRHIEKILDEIHIGHLLALTGDKLIPLIEKSRSEKSDSPWHRTDLHLGIHWLFAPSSQSNEGQLQSPAQATKEKLRGQLTQREKLQSLLNICPKTILIQNFLAFRKIAETNRKPTISCVHEPVPIEVLTPVSKKDARARLGLPLDGRLVGFTGSIQRRKGVKLFLQAFSEYLIDADIRALLIGPFEDELRSLILADYQHLVEDGKLLVQDRVLDSETQHLAISSLDVVICNLLEHQWSSDIALRAIVAERPILASDGDWFRYMINQFACGMTISPPRSPRLVAEAICTSLGEFSDYRPLAETQQIKDFNHPGNYANTTFRAIMGNRSKLAEADLIEWPNQHGQTWTNQ